MREAIHFTFDGVSSEDMGVHIASTSGGLFEETFLPRRAIVETTVANRNKNYFKRVDSEPLSFSLTFFIYDWRNRDNLRQIARWLYKDYYKSLTFDTNPERIFYVIVEGDSSLMHNGAKDGYVTLNFRCDSPYTYSPVQKFEVEVNVDNQNMKYHILNEGDITVKPKAWITKKLGVGDIAIKNESNGQDLKLLNLQEDEEVFIDFENEEIISSLQYLGVYRYGDYTNNDWLKLIEGENILSFTGEFDIKIEYQLAYLAE